MEAKERVGGRNERESRSVENVVGADEAPIAVGRRQGQTGQELVRGMKLRWSRQSSVA